MKRILLHYIDYPIGGTNTVINDICHSYLSTKYDFVLVIQNESCGYNPFKALRFINKYKQIIRLEKGDSIYICGLQFSGFLMTVAAKLSGIKRVIVSIHGSEWDDKKRNLRKSILKYIIEPLTIRLADVIFTVCKSELTSNGAIRLGAHNNVFGVIYNRYPGIDYDSVRHGFRKANGIDENRIVVSIVGRVVEDKGHRYIIDAIRELNDNRFLFLIVGDGDYADVYKTQNEDLLLSDKARLLGKRSDVYEVLKETDVFLFASLHENHSMALMEAVNMRCAIICTEVGGNVEIIDNNQTGLYIPPCDSHSIVLALKKMENEYLRDQFVSEAIKRVPERFSTQNTLGRLDLLFENTGV